ncbi:uncharacterized protein PHACADRAFT_32450 [Phanerochaete carnosa HHB-10118-sp]|uniref:Uncharacterized protein n=1 Tax=Phanerochaete carnosa (strain HHB-10118-sp) TaxID=650164 RepID=K5WJI5_PHACS|nr:uncharacterized protein PHACADRAFT_32450 [Phanerochaete carnosa HHB-10118-sp]EKM50397.1 hypothetical protein PHACADRAFT_32450 [Phanerochaete carnosa HHB-10118-sp]
MHKFMQGLKSYYRMNWTEFVRDVKKFYKADKDDKSFMIHYDYNYYFWIKIPEFFRTKLESRLVGLNPHHNLANPFPVEDDCLISEPESGNSNSASTTEDSDSDSDDDELSEGDYYVKRKKFKKHSNRQTSKKHDRKQKKMKTKKSRRTVRFEKASAKNESDSDSDTSPARPSHFRILVRSLTEDDPEVEELIKQLRNMSINDPAYAVTYFKACNRNPLVKNCVTAPLDKKRPLRSIQRTFERDPPPYLAEVAPGYIPPPINRNCYGCGGVGHDMNRCQQLQEFFTQGVIKRNKDNRIVLSNGGQLFRKSDEDWVTAIKQAMTPSSNFISFQDGQFQDTDGKDEQDMRAHYFSCKSDEDYADNEYDQVFNAACPEKKITAACKEQFDGVWISSHRELKERRKGKNLPPAPPWQEPPREARKTANAPRIPVPTPAPNPIPIEVHQPVSINVNNDDAFMEDATQPPKSKVDKGKQQTTPFKDRTNAQAGPSGTQIQADPSGTKTDEEAAQRKPCRSELQTIVNPKSVMDKLLNTQITMAMEEFLADVIHPKNVPVKAKGIDKAMVAQYTWLEQPMYVAPKCMTASAFPSRHKSQLINVRVECDGMPITAIVDTESQLNIIYEKVWTMLIGRLMDVTRCIVMGDANGEEGILQGFVPGVPLICGMITTHTSLFVGDKAPFNLLLGCFWQRGNYVSIDEQPEGTYLQFKDHNFAVRYKMLATPKESLDSVLLEYLERTHHMISMVTDGEVADSLDKDDTECQETCIDQSTKKSRPKNEVSTKLQNVKQQPGQYSDEESIDTVREDSSSSTEQLEYDSNGSNSSYASSNSEILHWLDLDNAEKEGSEDSDECDSPSPSTQHHESKNKSSGANTQSSDS